MENELLQLCPIQFIEGINEGEKFEEDFEEACISARDYSSLAIEYNPTLTYSLVKLEVLLAYGEMPSECQISVEVRSNYGDKPGDVVLSHGTLIPQKRHSCIWNWDSVELEPVVVIHNKKYWVNIDTARGFFGLATAKAGREPIIMIRRDRLWVTYAEAVKGKVMLKFYGRVLPTAN